MRAWLVQRRQLALASDDVTEAELREMIAAGEVEVVRAMLGRPEVRVALASDVLEIRPASLTEVLPYVGDGAVSPIDDTPTDDDPAPAPANGHASDEVEGSEAPVVCPEPGCGAPMKSELGLSIHLAKSHGIAGKAPKSVRTRRRRAAARTDDAIACPDCDEDFHTFAMWERHRARAHPSGEALAKARREAGL